MSRRPPNLIVIIPDELRADCLGSYGHPCAQTPRLDRLAAQGTAFDQCHVQHTVCSPSRCSFLTGWYPHVCGHRSLWNLLTPEQPNLLKCLAQAGYEVTWFGKNDVFSPGCYPGTVRRVVGRSASYEEDGLLPDSIRALARKAFLFPPFKGPKAEEQYADEALALLRAHRPGAAPFCQFHAWTLPHPIYSVPRPWYGMHDPDRLPPLRPLRQDGPDFHALIRRYRGLEGLPADHELFRRIRAVYLDMIAYVDAQVGRILDGLDATGLAEDTLVVLLSDHGDWAGDHGLVEKWPSGVDDCLTRIPFIWRGPGIAAGHRVAEPVELIDLVPSLLARLGLPLAHQQFGRDLSPQLAGAAGDPERIAFTEGGYDAQEAGCNEGRNEALIRDTGGLYHPKGLQQLEHPASVARCVSLRTASHRLVRRSTGRHELYALASDPQELRNRIADPACAAVRGRLEQRLLDWYLATSDVVLNHHDRGHPAGI